MSKAPAKRTTYTKKTTPAPKKVTLTPKKTDNDAGIKNQLEPYGLTLDDIISVLEEDPKNLQYVQPGKSGEALANTAHGRDYKKEYGGKTGYCGKGVCDTFAIAKKGDVCQIGRANGCDVSKACETSGGYFNISYNAIYTKDALDYAPKGTTFTWGNQDNPKNRTGTGGFRYGHTTIKAGDDEHDCDYRTNAAGVTNLVLHKGVKGGPRYGSVMDLSIGKDAKFSPELINMALQKKQEKENTKSIATPPKQPPTATLTKFFKENPRICYLLLNQMDTSISDKIKNDGGQELIKYYNSLSSKDPKRVALDMLVSKGIKNPLDYAAVNKTIAEVQLDVAKLSNPAAYDRLRPATDQELKDLAMKTPYYAEMLLKKIDKDFSADISTSDKLDKYIKDLADKKQKGTISKKEANEYDALCSLSKKGLTSSDSKDKVNHEIAKIAKNYRTATKDEVFAMFDNTPFYATLMQRELGIARQGEHEFTSQEFKDYYEGKVIGKAPNTKKITPAEKKAIESLAMEGLTKSSTNVLATIHDIAEQYKGSVQQELSASMQKDASLANKKKEASAKLYAKNDKAKDVSVNSPEAEIGTIDITQLLQQGRDMC